MLDEYNKFLYIYFLFTLLFMCLNNKTVKSNIIHFLYKKIFALMNNKKVTKYIQTERNDEIKQLISEKYEDKYLEKYNSFQNERILTSDEILLEEYKFNELLDACLSQKRIELEKLEQEKKDIIQYLLENADENAEENAEEKRDNDNNFTFLQNSITELKSFLPNVDEIRKEAQGFVMNNILDNLQNSYVFEKTPLGNVAMCYNNKKGSFEYFSDNTIPYRYLETVARKYVITFYCKELFVDMNLQLKNAEMKREEEKEYNKQKENIIKTKDLFNTFKNNNSNKNSNLNKNNNDKFILKENANRFTHNGKFSNFIMLKKVDKKHVDKNYALSYKEFMKQKLET